MSEVSTHRSRSAPSGTGGLIESFVRDLRAAGYVRGTILQKHRIAVSFVTWLRGQRVSVDVADEAHAAAFLGRGGKRSKSRRTNERAAVRGFLRHLRSLPGPVPRRTQDGPLSTGIVRRYAGYLRNGRGLTERSVEVCLPYVQAFLNSRNAADGRFHPRAPDAQAVRSYLLERTRGRSSTYARLVATSLRSFLPFLFLHEETSLHLSIAVSTVRESLAKYVATIRALGTELRWPALILQRFIDFLEHEGAAFITTDRALRWATQSRGVQPATWARRLSIVRRFAVWVHATDPRTKISPQSLLPASHRRKPPHIYTDGELARLMEAAACLPLRTGPRPLTYEILIRLLASTGLRPDEALALDEPDVDLQQGILAIRDTKFGKSRFVPVAESVRAALTNYAERRDVLHPNCDTRAFLVSAHGHRLIGSVARRTFAKLTQAIGIRATLEGRRTGRGPRLQDLRHTFATRRLVAWYRAGLNVERLMPALATYLVPVVEFESARLWRDFGVGR